MLRTFRLVLFAVAAVCILTACTADAAVLDDVFEGIVENSFKKAGKSLDDVAGLRKAGDTFSTVLRNNDDIFDAAGAARRVADDDLLNLRKINFPAGSRYADDLMRLSKNQRVLAYALDDVTTRIARLPYADDIVEVTGSKGLLIGAAYGDDALEGAYRIAKQDEVWDMARSSARAIDGSAVQAIRGNGELSAFIDIDRVSRVGDIDTMDTVGAVLKKFGQKGLNSMEQFCAWAARHPKTTLLGLFVATVKLKPDLVLDAAGNLKTFALDQFTDVAAEAIIDLGGAVVSLPGTLGQKLANHSNMPFLGLPFAFLIGMGMLYWCKLTRFIPQGIFSWTKSGFQAIFRRRKPQKQI